MPLKLKKVGKIWHIHGSVNGERVRESAKTDSREHAEAQRKELQRDLEDRLYHGDLSFADAINFYDEKGGEMRFLDGINAHFGRMKLKDITAVAVSAYAAETYRDHEPSTIKRQFYVPMNAVMKAASEAGLCPAIRFKPPRVVKKPVDYAEDTWFRVFFANAGDRIKTFVFMITTTGARVSELCRLVVRDIDFSNACLIIRKTKSGKPRNIPVSPEALDMLSAWLRSQTGLTPETKVFGYANRWSVNQAIKRVCQRVNKREGQPVLRYLSSHKIGRHSFAARLLARGESLKTVAEAGGWASIQVVNENYGHLERSLVDLKLRQSSSAVFTELGSPEKLQQLPNSDRQEIDKVREIEELVAAIKSRHLLDKSGEIDGAAGGD